MKHLASVIGSSAFLFRAVVAPNGADLCNSSTGFNYHPQNENGQQAGIEAKAAFCQLVKNNPA